jgi:hypothetical protein
VQAVVAAADAVHLLDATADRPVLLDFQQSLIGPKWVRITVHGRIVGQAP